MRSAQAARSSGRLSTAEIVRRLRRCYGAVDVPRDLDPLGELVFTVLSQHTSDRNSLSAFEELRRRFPRWEDVSAARASAIAAAIRRGGLANQKAPRIKRILQEIHARHGQLNLDFLHTMPIEAAKRYLAQFNGVGPKTAACVLLFACGKPVLPVDTHVHRVAKRLGLLSERATAEQAHNLLAMQIPAARVLDFHVLLVRHGRQTCVARHPKCDRCVLLSGCPTGRRLAIDR